MGFPWHKLINHPVLGILILGNPHWNPENPKLCFASLGVTWFPAGNFVFKTMAGSGLKRFIAWIQSFSAVCHAVPRKIARWPLMAPEDLWRDWCWHCRICPGHLPPDASCRSRENGSVVSLVHWNGYGSKPSAPVKPKTVTHVHSTTWHKLV